MATRKFTQKQADAAKKRYDKIVAGESDETVLALIQDEKLWGKGGISNTAFYNLRNKGFKVHATPQRGREPYADDMLREQVCVLQDRVATLERILFRLPENSETS